MEYFNLFKKLQGMHPAKIRETLSALVDFDYLLFWEYVKTYNFGDVPNNQRKFFRSILGENPKKRLQRKEAYRTEILSLLDEAIKSADTPVSVRAFVVYLLHNNDFVKEGGKNNKEFWASVKSKYNAPGTPGTIGKYYYDFGHGCNRDISNLELKEAREVAEKRKDFTTLANISNEIKKRI